MTADRDLRHAGFVSGDFASYAGWVLLGNGSTYLRWEDDGLFRVAQWSPTAGLHLFTEDLHKSCLRVICPWNEAKDIIYRLRRFK